jgi:hypothetical protein
MLAYRADRVKIMSIGTAWQSIGKKRLLQGRNDIIVKARDDIGLAGV